MVVMIIATVMENPYIFITDKKLSTIQDIQAIAEKVLQAADRPLLIIADEIEKEYNILGVFDDRQRVVNMWIDRGIWVFDVGQGKANF